MGNTPVAIDRTNSLPSRSHTRPLIKSIGPTNVPFIKMNRKRLDEA